MIIPVVSSPLIPALSNPHQSPDGCIDETIDHVVERVVQAVGYLKISLDAPESEGWLCSATLIDDPPALIELIRSTASGRGAPHDAVAASLFVQGYAFRVAGLVLAPNALGLASPSCASHGVHIRIERNRPSAVAVTDHRLSQPSASELAQSLLGSHLESLISVVAEHLVVGRRMLWGNVAASIATVFRAIESSPSVDRDDVRRRAFDFFVSAEPWLDGLGGFEMVDGDWHWTRTNCCLWYQCSGGSRCNDCSLHTVDELATIRLASRAGSGSAS